VPGLPNVAAFAAPASSHIHSWRFFDLRLYPDLPNVLGAVVSLMFVRFRDKKSGGPSAEYVYGFVDPDVGQSVSDAMQASAHPYGTVLVPRVIKTGLPYRPA
jgi:hypothetical protein